MNLWPPSASTETAHKRPGLGAFESGEGLDGLTGVFASSASWMSRTAFFAAGRAVFGMGSRTSAVS